MPRARRTSRSSTSTTSTASPRRTCCRSRSSRAPRVTGSSRITPGRARAGPARPSATPACSSTRTGCRATAARSCRCSRPPASPAPASVRSPVYRTPDRRRGRLRRGRDVEDIPVNVLRGEQSNTSVVFGETVHLKTVRRVRTGREPRGRDRACAHRPDATSRTRHRSLGTLEYRPASARRTTADTRRDARVRPERDATRTRGSPMRSTRFFEEALSHPERIRRRPAAA